MTRNVGRALGLTLLAVATVGLSGCSVLSWFGFGGPKLAELEKFTPSATGGQVWTVRQDNIDYSAAVAVAGRSFVIAGNDGQVQALQAATGKVEWTGSFGKKLAAGVGSDGRFAAAITRENDLVVLDAGKKVWSRALTTPVRTAPLVAGERVFVLTVDRQVLAFDAADGRRLWELTRPGDPLTLSQAGGILAYKDTLVVGQGARLAGVDPLRGTLRWEANVANPRGTNEVERLADVVGPVARSGESLCARAFQSAVGCVNAERGSNVWIRNNAGRNGVSADAEGVIGADASDRITAWKLTNGDVLWTADQLQNRSLSAPLVLGKSVVFGDAEGYVHVLDRASGKTAVRLPTDGSAVVAAPVAADGIVLIATRKGGLFALKLE